MSKRIRLSEKHGMNPSLGVCFWCGEEDGTVLLVGQLPGDKEAPRRMTVSYDPCAKCKKRFAQGILLIEASPDPIHEGQVEMGAGAYPTGRYLVVTQEWIERVIRPPELSQQITRKRNAFIDRETFEALSPSAAETARG
jgi:hypothetical protein